MPCYTLVDRYERIKTSMAFYPIANRLNHSCDPNVSLQFEHNKLFVTTLREIKKGEELCISYGPAINYCVNSCELLL